MAVKQDGHDLAYRVGDVVTELLGSGTVKGIYDLYGLTHSAPAD